MPGQSRFALAIRPLSSRNQKRFIAVYFKVRQLLSDAITGYVDVKLTFTQEQAYMLQEYDQQSDS